MLMKTNAAALAAALLLAGILHADAALVPYADFGSWSTAVPGYNSLAIPDPGPSGFEHFGSGSASVSYGGILFATNSALSNGDFFNIGSAFSGFPAVLSSQQQTQGVPNILITLAAPVTAFALNFDTFYGADVTFTLSNGETLTLGSGANAYDLKGFFGVVDSNPFKTILVTSEDPVLNINGLNFGAAVAPIPEPATWVMLILGFLGIGVFGARRHVRHAAAS